MLLYISPFMLKLEKKIHNGQTLNLDYNPSTTQQQLDFFLYGERGEEW